MSPAAPLAEAPRPSDKSPDAFRTISEVADDLDLPQHVLRFWETRFSQIKPLKRGGGRRYYRPDDVDLLRGIRHLLYGQGYTIKGVQRILKERGARFVGSVGRGEQHAAPPQPHPDADEAEPAFAGSDMREEDRRDVSPTDDPSSAPTLSEDDVTLLRQAYDELTECDRLLRGLGAVPSDEA